MEENLNENMNQNEALQETAASSEVPVRRRRQKSKAEIFKETTLPLIILGVSAVLILVFIVGSVVRGIQKNRINREASIAVSESIANEEARLSSEIETILTKSEALAAGYAYDEAIALIDSFSGNIGGYPELQDARARFEYSKQAMVLWEEPANIINLSFQTLIADPERAYNHPEWGSSLLKNYLTTDEFRNILQRLYDADYILVGMDDIVQTATDDNGVTTYAYKELYLPEGKKPLMLTNTNVNYPIYLVDSDGDMLADQGGVGIASKLVLDSSGNVTCEMVNADGTTSTGAYDFIPILDEFVREHPDFSYGGSKATIALSGYNGLFGYRTHGEGRAVFGEEAYQKDVQAVQAIATALQESGYELGYYTYANSAYGKHGLSMIQSEMNSWNSEVVPILGNLDTMVFAQESDIESSMQYTSDKFNYLKSCGFNYFLGYGLEGVSYTYIDPNYVRQGRLMVNGKYITYQSSWYSTIFDTEDVLIYGR